MNLRMMIDAVLRLEQVCNIRKYTSLAVVPRITEVKDGVLTYEFLDYYPEGDQEGETCVWTVSGMMSLSEKSVERVDFEVIAVFYEEEAADAFLNLLQAVTGIPIFEWEEG